MLAAPAPAWPEEVDEQQRQRLLALHGLDAAAALARLRGQWPLLLRTLRLFCSHYADVAEQLAGIDSEAQIDGLRRTLHSLVGAAATIGATEVHRQASALERMLSHPPTPGWAPATLALGLTLGDCVRCLQTLLNEPAHAGSTELSPARVDKQQLHQVLVNLAELLMNHDTAACALFERQRTVLNAGLGSAAVRPLAHAIQNYSFDEALQTLQTLRPL